MRVLGVAPGWSTLAPFLPVLTTLLIALLASPALAAAADPCDQVGALPDARTCGDQPLCSQQQRVKLACELRDAMEQRYVFYAVKGEMLPKAERFDSRRHLDACIAGERAIAREDDPLHFYDRMRRCTAAFQDGHLTVGAPVRLPRVALGIGLRLVEGKVYVANRERKLVSYLRTVSGLRDLEDTLAIGNEVVAIDGRPVAQVLDEMARYEPGSSEAARLERAVDALTRRDFDYPTRRVASLTVKVGGARRTVELPWWIAPTAESHAMAQAYLKKLRLPTTDLLQWKYDQANDSWEHDAGSLQGSLRTDTILPARDAAALREYTDEGDRTAVRLGEVVRRRDRAFCYLQILSFHTESLTGRDGRRPFSAVLEDFVKGCKEKDLDLVLDLRQNEGGYLAHTSTLFAMLGEPSKSYAGGALLLRATTMNELIYQQRAPVGAATGHSDDAFDPRHIADAIAAAQRARADFTPAFLEKPLRASDAVGGYGGRVVALVAPTCMSACDRLALLLQRSGRATLLGAPTEGAGGSQQETRALPVRWSDPGGVLSVSMPNAAMGIQTALLADAHLLERSSEDFFEQLTFENRPVVPDVAYRTSTDDLVHGNRGWLERTEAALFAPPAGAGMVAHAPSGGVAAP